MDEKTALWLDVVGVIVTNRDMLQLIIDDQEWPYCHSDGHIRYILSQFVAHYCARKYDDKQKMRSASIALESVFTSFLPKYPEETFDSGCESFPITRCHIAKLGPNYYRINCGSLLYSRYPYIQLIVDPRSVSYAAYKRISVIIHKNVILQHFRKMKVKLTFDVPMIDPTFQLDNTKWFREIDEIFQPFWCANNRLYAPSTMPYDILRQQVTELNRRLRSWFGHLTAKGTIQINSNRIQFKKGHYQMFVARSIVFCDVTTSIIRQHIIRTGGCLGFWPPFYIDRESYVHDFCEIFELLCD